MDDIITLDYGSGGLKTSRLIEDTIIKYIGNNTLNEMADAASIEGSTELLFSTDSFVVSPYFFPGGNIGKLSVCGTVNDVAVSGGEPKYLSLGLIIEEGFSIKDLEEILKAIRETADKAGVKVVTGDTKVVERGKGDGIYINTAGIGFKRHYGLSTKNIKEGDAVIVSGNIGEHGTAIMIARNTNLVSGEIISDCGLVNNLTSKLLPLGENVRIMRDPTRGGVATTLCEFVEREDVGIELNEADIPVSDGVNSACEILGLDPLYCACEGRLLVIVDKAHEEEALSLLRSEENGKDAKIIGHVTENYPGKVVLKTGFGSRIINKLTGEQLPRIC